LIICSFFCIHFISHLTWNLNPYLKNTKARTDLLPPALDAAGLPGFPYTGYYEIAALMKPEEIHPEVVEKLNLIMQAFGL
jgi:hypothetical protein